MLKHIIPFVGRLGVSPKLFVAVAAICGLTLFALPSPASAETYCVLVPGFGWFCF